MKFLGKLTATAVATTLAVAVPSAANAAQFFNNNGSSATFGFDASPPIPAGAFTHTYTFSIAVPNVISGTVTSVAAFINAPNDVTFTSATLNGTPFTINLAGQVELRTILNLATATNPQTLIVSGISLGSGVYDGTLAFASVPEPSTWAMLIFGFGMAGAAMRRRRTTAKIAFA
ncbi:MAG: FxDxF family PEP-CTERM protein [Parasphingorhabdus sp.]|nr:FxDxF family PEP-CTERM protein [Parasphingorhabdus sp.]